MAEDIPWKGPRNIPWEGPKPYTQVKGKTVRKLQADLTPQLWEAIDNERKRRGSSAQSVRAFVPTLIAEALGRMPKTAEKVPTVQSTGPRVCDGCQLGAHCNGRAVTFVTTGLSKQGTGQRTEWLCCCKCDDPPTETTAVQTPAVQMQTSAVHIPFMKTSRARQYICSSCFTGNHCQGKTTELDGVMWECVCPNCTACDA